MIGAGPDSAPPPPSTARYRAARALFEQLLDLPPDLQAARLAEVADPDLRAEVAALLQADGSAADLAEVARTLRMPATIGPYRVIRELGRGAVGVVYEAEESAPHRRVALKALHPWLRSDLVVSLIRREAQALADLQHPGIPSMFALLDVDGLPVVAMELVAGIPVTEWARRRTVRERLEVLARLCEAVEVAHRHGIVHRDIKPANVLVTADGQPKVLDFGIAQHPSGAAPPGSGTPAYMAPEQRAGLAEASADVYALGVLSCEVLTGALPSPAGTSPPLREDIAAVLDRALATRPEDRYRRAGDLADELRRVLSDRPVRALEGSAGAWLRAATRRHRAGVWAGLSVTALGIALGLAAPGLLDRAHQARSQAILDELVTPGSTFSDAEVRARLDGLLRDPRLIGTSAGAAAWRAVAERSAAEEALGAAIAAWAWAPNGELPAAQDQLIATLLAADRPEIAARLGPATDPTLADKLALIRWDLPAVSPTSPGRPWLAALSGATEVGPTSDEVALFHGTRLISDATGLRVGRATWRPPGQVHELVPTGDHLVVRGQAFAGVGRMGEVDPPWWPTSKSADATLADLDGDGRRQLVVLSIGDHPGIFRIGADGQHDLHPGTGVQELPGRAMVSVDVDHDGRDEIAVAATGWKGHELRLLGGTSEALRVLARLRMSAWDVVGLPSGELLVLGGPLPAEPVAHGARTTLYRVALVGGADGPRLEVRAEVDLPGQGIRLEAADLDGDGQIEAVIEGWMTAACGLMIADPSGGRGVLNLPGIGLLAVGQADGDAADELWVQANGSSWIWGTGQTPAPTRVFDTPARAEAPGDLRGASAREAWRRLEVIASAGASDELAPALSALLALGGAETSARALQLVLPSTGLPGRGALALMQQVERSPRVEDVGSPPDEAPTATITFREPLGPIWWVGQAGSVWRDPLAASLSLDVRGDTGIALALPLERVQSQVCVELDMDVVEVDWSAGLSVRLRGTTGQVAHELRRVGGGPRDRHHLVLGGPGAVARVPFATGPHHVTVCAGGGAGIASVRLDDQQAAWDRPPEALGEGPLWLELSGWSSPGDDPDGRALLRLLALRLRGARPAVGGPPWPDPGEEVRIRRQMAEGDPTAARHLLARGTPVERAWAAITIGLPQTLALSTLSGRDRRELLRKAPATWAPLLRASDEGGFSALWLDAWSAPLTYEDPWSDAALISPTLAGLPAATPEQHQLTLARAQALMGAGQVAWASEEIARLRGLAPEAQLLSARLHAHSGRPDLAREELRLWLAAAASPEAAVDRLVDDPVLAALLPEVVGAPAVRAR